MCDCELRWYHQWINEEWSPVEEEWLKETFCIDPVDDRQHKIAKVPLKDMFCNSDVQDKPSTRVVRKKNLIYQTFGGIFLISDLIFVLQFLFHYVESLNFDH